MERVPALLLAVVLLGCSTEVPPPPVDSVTGIGPFYLDSVLVDPAQYVDSEYDHYEHEVAGYRLANLNDGPSEELWGQIFDESTLTTFGGRLLDVAAVKRVGDDFALNAVLDSVTSRYGEPDTVMTWEHVVIRQWEGERRTLQVYDYESAFGANAYSRSFTSEVERLDSLLTAAALASAGPLVESFELGLPQSSYAGLEHDETEYSWGSVTNLVLPFRDTYAAIFGGRYSRRLDLVTDAVVEDTTETGEASRLEIEFRGSSDDVMEALDSILGPRTLKMISRSKSGTERTDIWVADHLVVTSRLRFLDVRDARPDRHHVDQPEPSVRRHPGSSAELTPTRKPPATSGWQGLQKTCLAASRGYDSRPYRIPAKP